MRTPLAQVRGLGSAKTGTGEYVAQWLTSVALVFLLALFVIIVVALNGEPRETVVAAIASPPVALVLLAGILVTMVHMRLGLQMIIEDYVHEERLKIAALVGNWVFSWGVGLIAVFAVLKIAFGGA
jgi:succinate dehydrogenase / fumarate reductase membrane anchor subunit